jgi:hypothetical protein
LGINNKIIRILVIWNKLINCLLIIQFSNNN